MEMQSTPSLKLFLSYLVEIMPSRAVSLSLKVITVATVAVDELILTGEGATTDSHLHLTVVVEVAEVDTKGVGVPLIIIDQPVAEVMAAELVRAATSHPDQVAVAGRMMEIVDGESIN